MQTSNTPPPWFLWMIFGGIGALLLGLGLWFLFSELAFGKRAVTAQGTVVDFESRRGKSGTVYAPVVEFEVEGRRIRFTSGTASSPRSYDTGDAVPVLYEPARPEEARIDTFMQRFFLPFVFGLLGLIFAGVGVGLFFSRSARR